MLGLFRDSRRIEIACGSLDRMFKLLFSSIVFAATLVKGPAAVDFANELARSGDIQDGVTTDAGPASRVYGTYRGQPAYFDYLWGHREVYECSLE